MHLVSKTTRIVALITSLIIVVAVATADAQEISLTKIHDDGTYNAFTDLAKFQGQYYCVFRSAISHGGASHGVMGAIVVIRSTDTKTWEEVARFTEVDVDLRDPKLLVTPTDIRVYAVDCRQRPKGAIQYANCVWSSTDGATWSDATLMAPGYIFWRPKMNDGKFYVPAYVRRPGYCGVDILVSDDGYDWHMLSTPIPPAKVQGETLWANETEILFLENGKALLFARRNYTGTPNPELAKFGGFRAGIVLQSDAATLTQWDVLDESLYFHCPAAVEHDGRIFLTGRDRLKKADGRYTETGRLWEFVVGKGFTELVHFKTHGDSSYMGIVAEGDEVLVSYYSTHEGMTAYFEKPG
ncbi:MAG: glycoside hydrolase, partial [Candidatus Hydrogenedentes bacterium]|nr:glycoside hydrolase [Candidatus Hydrogenedentota bacterium]